EVWNYLTYGDPYSPLLAHVLMPDDQGLGRFVDYLHAVRDTSLWFPASLFVPASLHTVSTVFGAAPFLVLLVHPDEKRAWIALIVAVVLCVGISLLAQRNARFYIEPYFLLMGALAMSRSAAPQVTKVAKVLTVTQLAGMA